MDSPCPSTRLGQDTGCPQHHHHPGSGWSQPALPLALDLRLTGHQESRIQSLSPRTVSALGREEGRTSPAPRASGIREGWVILAAFFANRIPVGLSKNPIRERRREIRRTHTSQDALHQGPEFSDSEEDTAASFSQSLRFPLGAVGPRGEPPRRGGGGGGAYSQIFVCGSGRGSTQP